MALTLMWLGLPVKPALGQFTYTLTDLGVLSGTDSGPRGITNGGAIVLNQEVAGFPRGFFVSSGSAVNIGTLGGSTTQSTSVVFNTTLSTSQIAGTSVTAGGATHAFLWTQGGTGGVSGNPQMKDLGVLGGVRSEGYSVNATGQVTGYSEVSSGYEHAFLFNGTSLTDVGALINTRLGLPWSYGYGINASSRVVGTAFDDAFTTAVAFSYDGSTVRNLGNLGFAWSEALAINDSNQIVGYSTLSDGSEEAFFWNGSTMATLGSLGGSSYAQAINNSGVVVGGSYVDVADTTYRAFVTVSGTMRNLTTLLDASGQGWTLIEALDVNDVGQIVGYGMLAGTRHGFLLTPAAAPLTWSASGTQVGGSGTWSGVATTWLSGTTRTAWTPSARAVFAGTAGTVTVSGSVSVAAGIDVQANGFTITGGTLAMAGGTGAAARTISVASAATLTLATTLTGSTGLVKSGSGTLVLRGTNPLSGTATVSDGTLRLASESALGNATIAVGDAAVLKVGALVHSTVAGLDLAAAGKVDVNDGMMTVTSGLAPATLVARLIEGRGDGSWTGTSGITSSVAASDVAVSIPRAVGWLDNGDGSVTAAFAAPGDTNLDWQVDVLDASNFLSFGKFDSGLPAIWLESDFNYDGVVDVLDAADFFGTGLYDAGSYNPPPGSVGAVAAVPEPSSVPVVACGLITAIGWHLRRLFGGVKAP